MNRRNMLKGNQVFKHVGGISSGGRMMRKWQSFYAVASITLLIVAIVGCGMFDSEKSSPTMPESSGNPPIGGLPGETPNFWVGSGTTDHLGVHIASGYFLVNVPKKGVFLLTYFTEFGGPFHLVVMVEKNSLLFVGLQPGDEVAAATIQEGDLTTIAPTSPEVQYFGGVTVYYRPGFIGNWGDFIVINQQINVIVLIQNYIVVVSDDVKTLTTTGKLTTKTSKKTKKS